MINDFRCKILPEWYDFMNVHNHAFFNFQFVKSSSSHSSVVIYSLVIRSCSHRFPFQKGKNEGNISENDMIKNDATSRSEGT